MDNCNINRSARFPETYYYVIRPTVSSIVAEMDDMSVAYPTQGMYNAILERVYDQVVKMHPNQPQNQAIKSSEQNPSNSDYQAEQFFPPFFEGSLISDLLGVLILFELLDRRWLI